MSAGRRKEKYMEYQRFGNTIIARIDKGEEILSMVKAIAEKEKIRLASVSALGAVRSFTVGVFKIDEKQFSPNDFEGTFEIAALIGTIDTMNGQFYTHLHMSAADENGKTVGGHISRAVVSATCEMVINVIDGEIDRQFDDETGLNLMRFR